eukprot:SAG31_NODE_6437_length_2018_cov_14.547160_1_plen_277_part_00
MPMLLLLLLLLLPLLRATMASPSSEVDLDGMWDFEADPDGVGVAQRWFDALAKPRLAERIAVPGAWQSFADGARGVGAETPLLRRQFSGVGWYRRLVDVSSKPDGATCWLWLGGAPGGVMRKADVYSNSQHIGRHVGYLDPVEVQVRSYFLVFVHHYLEKYGTFIARCNALIEKVSSFPAALRRSTEWHAEHRGCGGFAMECDGRSALGIRQLVAGKFQRLSSGSREGAVLQWHCGLCRWRWLFLRRLRRHCGPFESAVSSAAVGRRFCPRSLRSC